MTTDPGILRLAPHSPEAEEAVIGGVLTDPSLFASVASYLGPDDFHINRLALIWQAMNNVSATGAELDLLLVSEEIRTLGKADQFEDKTRGFLVNLINRTPTSVHTEAYARVVQRLAVRRRHLTAADEIKELAYDEQIPVERIEVESDRRLMLARRTSGMHMVTFADALNNHFAKTEDLMQNPRDLLGIPSVIPELNGITKGYQKGKLYIGAGRPGMGKSSHMYAEVTSAARNGYRVLLASLEVTDSEATECIIAAEAGIDLERLEPGTLNAKEYSRYVEATGRMATWGITINDQGSLTPMELRNQARALSYKQGLDMIFVDYLQLMSGGREQSYSNRDQEIGYISRSLKELAKELRIPVYAAAQLNRDVENRPDKRPQLSDLRESGNIENDADLVMFFYRNDYYFPVEPAPEVSTVEIAVAKHRGGKRGMVNAGFWGARKTFVPVKVEKRDFKNL